MKRHFDIRKYFYLLVAAALLMYVLSTFIFGKAPLTVGGVLLGLAFLAATAMAVYFTVDFFAVTINHAAPVVFAILALSFPSVAIYVPTLWCVLAANAAFYCAARFYGGDISDNWVLLYSALLSVASMLFPPMVWMALFLLIMNFFPAGDKIRFIVSSLVGFLLPAAVYLTYIYVTGDARELLPAVSGFFKATVTARFGLGAISAARAIKILTLLVCCIVSLVSFLKRSAQYSLSHSHVMTMIFAYSAAITLLVILFPPGGVQAATMLVMAPVSLVIYDYLIWGADDRGCRITLAFLALAVILEFVFAA